MATRDGAAVPTWQRGRRPAPPGRAATEAVPEGELSRAARAQRHDLDWEAIALQARQRSAGERPEVTSKRSLIAVSHAIERALLAGPVEPPTVVFAMFQRLTYFDREREMYGRLLDSGVHVVVGFTDGEAHDLPPGAVGVTLQEHEPLADEWTVVALGPRAGAFLVATDRYRFDPTERHDLEAARQFEGRWGYSHVQAATETARLRLALGPRLDRTTAGIVDGLLARTLPTGGQPASGAGTPGETWATTSLFHMVDRMQTARAGTRQLRDQLADAHAAAAARTAATVDPQSGLTNPDFLARWSSTGGTTALPIGIGLFDVAELEAGEYRYDPRRSYHAARTVAAALTQPLGPVDAAVRLSEREFAVVVPGASAAHLAAICDDVAEQLTLATAGYPHIPLNATVATVVTRSRPLPLADLYEALGRLGPDAPGPLDAGTTLAGDAITVTSVPALRAHATVVEADPEPVADVESADLDVPPGPTRPSPLPRREENTALSVLGSSPHGAVEDRAEPESGGRARRDGGTDPLGRPAQAVGWGTTGHDDS